MDGTTITGASVLDFTGRWLIVRVRPQREKQMARQLQIEGVQHFLPIESIIKQYLQKSGHYLRKTLERIPWPGYVFACGELESTWWQIAAAADRAGLGGGNPSRFINPVVNPTKLIFALDAYQKNMQCGARPYHEENIRRGSRVVIKSGPYCGYEGPVDHVTDFTVVVVTMFMGAARPISIDRNAVEIV
jgi:transcription antitermination factor NusG